MITSFKQFNESWNYNYDRVIPRDFFNESKLLKCLGKLSVKILDNQVPDGISIYIEESGEPFNVILNEEWEILTVSNYEITINDTPYLIGTFYNSKSLYPLVVIKEEEAITIFDESGNWSEEFIQAFIKSDI